MNEDLKQQVCDALTSAIDDVFLKLQEEHNIQTGDIAPLDALDLDRKQDALAEVITRVLEMQMLLTASRPLSAEAQVTRRVQVTGVTLLSKDEYEQNRDLIPKKDDWWWLRSAKDRQAYSVSLGGDAGCVYALESSNGAVFPALQCDLAASNLTPGDKVILKGQSYTALRGDLLLKDKLIGRSEFRKEWKAPGANAYETSDVRNCVEQWYEKEFGRTVSREEEVER